jgi:hypothetical protein
VEIWGGRAGPHRGRGEYNVDLCPQLPTCSWASGSRGAFGRGCLSSWALPTFLYTLVSVFLNVLNQSSACLAPLPKIL